VTYRERHSRPVRPPNVSQHATVGLLQEHLTENLPFLISNNTPRPSKVWRTQSRDNVDKEQEKEVNKGYYITVFYRLKLFYFLSLKCISRVCYRGAFWLGALISPECQNPLLCAHEGGRSYAEFKNHIACSRT
jgi:hypothetical protein